jgi:hypothetical protein
MAQKALRIDELCCVFIRILTFGVLATERKMNARLLSKPNPNLSQARNGPTCGDQPSRALRDSPVAIG